MPETGYTPLLLMVLATALWLWTRKVNPNSLIPSIFFLAFQAYIGVGTVVAALPLDVAGSVFLSDLFGPHAAAYRMALLTQLMVIAFLLPWSFSNPRLVTGIPVPNIPPIPRDPRFIKSSLAWIAAGIAFQATMQLIIALRFQLPLLSPDFEVARGYILANGGWKLILPSYMFMGPVVLAYAAILKDWTIYSRSKRGQNISKSTIWKLRIAVLFCFFLYGVTGIAVGFRTFFIFSILIILWSSLLFGNYRAIGFAFIGFILFFILAISFSYTKFSELDVNNDGIYFIVAKTLNRVSFQGYAALLLIDESIDRSGILYGQTFIMQINTYFPIKDAITYGGMLGKEAGFDEGFTLTPTIAGESYANFSYVGIFAFFVFGYIVKRWTSISRYQKENFNLIKYFCKIMVASLLIVELITIDTGAFIVMAIRLALLAIVFNVRLSVEPSWSATTTAPARLSSNS